MLHHPAVRLHVVLDDKRHLRFDVRKALCGECCNVAGAPLLKEWRKDIVAGRVRRDLAIARVTMGTGIAAAILQMASEGKVTGGGPADDGAKKLLMADGWKPYSFKSGNEYYSYQRLDPYSTLLGTAADLVDQQSYMTDKQRNEKVLLLGTAVLKNLSNKTWLSGLSTALQALNDPDRSLETFTSRTAGAIAVPAIFAQASRIVDPTLREARGAGDRIRSRIPGQSEGLFPRRDIFGRAIVSEGGIGPDIVSPIWTGKRGNDPTITAMLDAGAHVNAPSRKIGKRKLTPEEYDQYQVAVGTLLKPRLDMMVSAPAWKQVPAEDRKDMIEKLASDTRREARRSLFGAGGAAKGASAPPPPPGFTIVQ